jgi:hypothetical protein
MNGFLVHCEYLYAGASREVIMVLKQLLDPYGSALSIIAPFRYRQAAQQSAQ